MSWATNTTFAGRKPDTAPLYSQVSLLGSAELPGTKKFCISLTHAKNDTDKATVAFVVANAAVASDQKTMVFLSIEGARLSQEGYADDIHEEGFAPLRELMGNFVKAGGIIYVCSPCFKKRSLDQNNLVAGATIVGGAKLVEYLADGTPCVSY